MEAKTYRISVTATAKVSTVIEVTGFTEYNAKLKALARALEGLIEFNNWELDSVEHGSAQVITSREV